MFSIAYKLDLYFRIVERINNIPYSPEIYNELIGVWFICYSLVFWRYVANNSEYCLKTFRIKVVDVAKIIYVTIKYKLSFAKFRIKHSIATHFWCFKL